MNYSSSLPKITFESSAGNYTITSFFSFYDYDTAQFDTTDITVDNKTTLTELSQQIYSDNNSIWLFMLANQNVDPFKILAENPVLYTDKVQDQITLGLQDPNIIGVSNYINSSGSLILPYTGTSGNPWEYSYVGNFNLDGAFALVDKTEYFTAKMTIKKQIGGTKFIDVDSANDSVLTIENTSTGYTTDDAEYETKNKTQAKDDSVIISQKDSGILDPGESNYPAESFFLPPAIPSYGNEGATLSITSYEVVLAQNKNIKAFIPSSISLLFGKLGTIEY